MSLPDVKRFDHGSRVPGWDDAVDLTKDPQEIPDPATTPVPAQLRAEIERHIAKYLDRRSAAIPALAAAQELHGWCSPEAFIQVACVMRLTPAYLRFYHAMYQALMFSMNLALLANNIGLMWVAIELATLTTVLMVGIYRTHEAL